jgi:hypothetical protein
MAYPKRIDMPQDHLPYWLEALTPKWGDALNERPDLHKQAVMAHLLAHGVNPTCVGRVVGLQCNQVQRFWARLRAINPHPLHNEYKYLHVYLDRLAKEHRPRGRKRLHEPGYWEGIPGRVPKEVRQYNKDQAKGLYEDEGEPLPEIGRLLNMGWRTVAGWARREGWVRKVPVKPHAGRTSAGAA